MSRPGVSQNEVVRVAIRLLSQGKSPSVRNVWRGLGERGSFETISKHLEDWRGSLSEASLEVLPPTLPQVLIEPLEALWTVAVQEAAAQYVEARAAAETAVEQAQATAHDAQRLAESARAEVTQLHAELESRAEALQSAQTRLQDLTTQVHARDAELDRIRREHAQNRGMTDERIRLLQKDAVRQQRAHEEKVHQLEARTQIEIGRGEAQERHWLRLLDEARAQTKAIEQRAAVRERELVDQLAKRGEQLEAVQAQRLAAEARLEARNEERERLIEQKDKLAQHHQQEVAQRQADQQMHQLRLHMTWQRALECAEQVVTTKKLPMRDKLRQLGELKERQREREGDTAQAEPSHRPFR